MRRVSSHYRMKGMGVLLNMYGGASKALEEQIEKKRKELNGLQRMLDTERDALKRENIRIKMKEIDEDIKKDVEKLKDLWRGASKTTGDAAMSLGGFERAKESMKLLYHKAKEQTIKGRDKLAGKMMEAKEQTVRGRDKFVEKIKEEAMKHKQEQKHKEEMRRIKKRAEREGNERRGKDFEEEAKRVMTKLFKHKG